MCCTKSLFLVFCCYLLFLFTSSKTIPCKMYLIEDIYSNGSRRYSNYSNEDTMATVEFIIQAFHNLSVKKKKESQVWCDSN